MQPSGPSDVVTDETDVIDGQLERIGDRGDAKCPDHCWPGTQKPRAHIPDNLVDQIGPHERGRKGRASFEENMVNVAGEQVIENRADVVRGAHESAGASRHVLARSDGTSRSPTTTRSGCRGNRASFSSLAVSCGSSASTVPVPTMTASTRGTQSVHLRTRRRAADPSAASRLPQRPDRPTSPRAST